MLLIILYINIAFWYVTLSGKLCQLSYFGYLGDDIISRMASVEIPFLSVVYVMFNYCHVIVYVQIEK